MWALLVFYFTPTINPTEWSQRELRLGFFKAEESLDAESHLFVVTRGADVVVYGVIRHFPIRIGNTIKWLSRIYQSITSEVVTRTGCNTSQKQGSAHASNQWALIISDYKSIQKQKIDRGRPTASARTAALYPRFN